MQPPPLALGFDLDYTLWDQDGFAVSLFETLAGELGQRLGCGRAAVARALNGAHRRLTLAHPTLFDAVLRDLGAWDAALVAELVRRYRAHRPPARPYPGVEAILARLAGRGLPLFLVTDGQPASQRHKVAALGLAPWFRVLVFTGEFPPERHKPSCFPFLYACARLGLEPSRCVYVGDDPRRDFLGPRQLGMHTVGVATGPYAGLAVAAEQAPRQRIRSLDELEGLL